MSLSGKKILLSAYACEPGKGSEPAVGWNWAGQMSQRHEVWVLTRANNRTSVESSAEGWVKRVHWVYYDLPAWMRFWKRGGRGVQFYYWLWQIGALLKAKELSRRVALDLIHHVTFGNLWIPSYMGLCGVPFIFGPVGGGEDTPPGLIPSLGPRQRRYERLRAFLRSLCRFDPFFRRSVRKAIVLPATQDSAAFLARSFGSARMRVFPQFGMSPGERGKFGSLKAKAGGPFRLISIGRLVHWKGYHLAIMAFAQVLKRIPDAEYWVVSTGPEQEALQTLAREAGCGSQISFLGRLGTLGEVYSRLEESDVLVHPALHEAFGISCLEALASGRPVICLNGGGPGLQVTRDVGIAVEPGSVEETITRMSEAMVALASDPERRERMSSAARDRVRTQFAFETMAEEMNRIYLEATAIGTRQSG